MSRRSVVNLNRITSVLALPLMALTIACGSGKKEGTSARPEVAKSDSTSAEATEGSAAAGTDARRMLDSALENMGKLTSYHAVADLLIGEQKARIDGDFAVGKVAFTVDRVDGGHSKNIVIGRDGWVSSDGGSNWQKDTSEAGLGLSTMVTAPVSPNMGLTTQGSISLVGTEDVDGTPTTHLRVEAKSPVDLWISDEPNVGRVVRRIHLFTTAQDNDINTTVTYSDFNTPVVIETPM